MENKFLRIDNKEEWQDFLNKVLFKTFFHNLEWEEFLEKNFKWLKFERYVWQNQALLSLARVRVAGKEKLISHPFCEYGGPLPLVAEIDGEKFKQDLFSEFKTPLRINLHPWISSYFKNPKLEGAESWRDTYWTEDFSKLKGSEFLASFRYDIRHAIKNAEKQGFTFEECRSEKDLKAFYKLYIKTMRRHKNIPVPISFFEFFWKSSKIYFLKKKEKIITGSVFLFYKPFIHYFITASDYKFRKFNVNHLLLWQVMNQHIGRDYDLFDLGATRRDSSLEIFKRGWRGKKVPIYDLSNQPAKTKLRDSRMRNLLGALPSCFVEKLSPYLLKYKL